MSRYGTLTSDHRAVIREKVVADPPTRFGELVLPNPNVSPLAVLLKKVLAGGGTLLDFGAHIGTVALPVALAGR